MTGIRKGVTLLFGAVALVLGGLALAGRFRKKSGELAVAFMQRCRRNHQQLHSRKLTQVPPRRYQQLRNLRD